VDPASGVSQRLPIAFAEAAAAGALRRHLRYGDPPTVRPYDLYKGLFAVTGKLEPSYEGEAEGEEAIAEDLLAKAFLAEFGTEGLGEARAWFESGGELVLPEGPLEAVQRALAEVPGLLAGRADPDALALAEARLEALVGEGFLKREEGRYRKP